MVFILCAIGSGIESIIENNIDPSFLIMVQNKEILYPYTWFFCSNYYFVFIKKNLF